MKNLTAVKSMRIISVLIFITFALFKSGYAQVESGTDNSNENGPVSIYVANNGNLKIAIDNPETQKYKISILDRSQKVWFEENTYRKVYKKTFDFNQNYQDAYEVVVSGSEKSYRFKLKRADEVKYSLVPVS
jgi:hypothetical protein